MGKLDEKLAGLATMSPAQLREEWQTSFGEDAPDVPASMLRRVIAYRLQEEALGGLPASALRMLDIVADGVTPLRLAPSTNAPTAGVMGVRRISVLVTIARSC